MQVPQRRRALGRHLVGAGLTQRAEDHVGQHLPDDVARRDGGGIARVQDGAFGRGDFHARQGTRVVGHVGPDQATDAKGCIGVRIGLHHVDAARHTGRSAVEIDPDLVRCNADTGLQRDRRVIAVDHKRVIPGALRPLGDGQAHGLFGLFDDVATQGVQIAQFELGQQRLQAARADGVAGDQRVKVAFHLFGLADVGADDGQHAGVDFVLMKEAQDGQEQAFVIDLESIGAAADAADVDHVQRRGK
ncbi:hypothetical protein D3C72_1249880 [compost metagenome]